MGKLARALAIVLMSLAIIVLSGCKKEENDNNDNRIEYNTASIIGTVWEGGEDYSFDYEGEHIDGYLSLKIAFIRENTAEFRLEGLPETNINRRVRVGEDEDSIYYFRFTSYFDFDGNHVPFLASQTLSGRWGFMEVKLNSGVAPNCGSKTQALFDQNNNLISIQLRYERDTTAF